MTHVIYVKRSLSLTEEEEWKGVNITDVIFAASQTSLYWYSFMTDANYVSDGTHTEFWYENLQERTDFGE
jgi:hypothetical protein